MRHRKNYSPEKQKTIDEMRHNVTLMLASFLAIIIVCLAWFISNIRVSTEAMPIATQTEPFYLATLSDDSSGTTDKFIQGQYDNLDTVQTETKDNESITATLKEKILSFIRGERTMEDAEGNTYIIGDSANISLLVSDASNMANKEAGQLSPGSSGRLDFYIIPNTDEAGSANIILEPEGYQVVNITKKEGSDTEYEANMTRINESVVQLMSGHILCFNKHENGRYGDWLKPTLGTETIEQEITNGETGKKTTEKVTVATVSLTREVSWEAHSKGEPVPVTIYWVWPQRFHNIQSTAAAVAILESGTTYESIIADINSNKDKYIYAYVDPDAPAEVKADMGLSDKALWDGWYNNADQHIGTNMNYLRMKISAKEKTDTTGTEE